jgi:hypothetical protein
MSLRRIIPKEVASPKRPGKRGTSSATCSEIGRASVLM